MAKKKRKTTTVSAVRDTITGRFLPKSAAKRRPKTTITERIRIGRGAKKK